MSTRGARMGLALGLLLAAVWLMGMGGSSDSGNASSIPIPDKSFTVTIEDTSGNRVEAQRFTWEGRTHFRAEYGNATVTLPFGKVARVDLEPGSDTALPQRIAARVTLHSGDTIEVSLDRTSKCYGDTRFGAYEIFLKDVASIQFAAAG